MEKNTVKRRAVLFPSLTLRMPVFIPRKQKKTLNKNILRAGMVWKQAHDLIEAPPEKREKLDQAHDEPSSYIIPLKSHS